MSLGRINVLPGMVSISHSVCALVTDAGSAMDASTHPPSLPWVGVLVELSFLCDLHVPLFSGSWCLLETSVTQASFFFLPAFGFIDFFF